MVDYDSGEDQDMDNTCAICGKHLGANNRSSSQPDLCLTCAGEEEPDENEDLN